MCQELQIFAVVYMYSGVGWSLVRLCDSDFGITPVDDITIGIICVAFCFHTAHISFASPWYFFCYVIVIIRIIIKLEQMMKLYYNFVENEIWMILCFSSLFDIFRAVCQVRY